MSNDSSKVSETASHPKPGRFPHPVTAFFVTVGLFLLGQFLGSLIVQLFMLVEGDGRSAEPALFGSPILLRFAFGLISYGCMLAMTAGFLRMRRLSFRDIGLWGPRLSDAGLALIALVVYISVFVTAASVLRLLLPGLDLDQKQDLGFDDATGAHLVLTFGLLVIVAPIVEEVMMRGLLFTSLRRQTPFWLAAVITSLLFAVLHLGGGEVGAGPLWIAAIDTMVLSLVLCYLRERTGRLWASIGLHMLKNSVAFMSLFILATSL